MSEELCRLCGKNSGLTSVFDENHLSFKISSCFGVKIEPTDTITKNICKSCYFFTNSVYEFRKSSISHDVKLKAEYKASQLKKEIKRDTSPISYPSEEISQNAFLNTFNLANKNNVVLQKSEFHPSVVTLKRKFPNIKIPIHCNELNLDPIVWVEIPPKLIKLNSDLGIWSVRSKQTRGKQPLVLTRVRSDSTSTKESKDSVSTCSDVSEKLKVKFNFNIKSTSSNSEQPPVKDKKKRKKYPDWSHSRKKKSKVARSSLQKKTSPEKVPKITKSSDSATPSTSSTTSENNRTKLKSLLESDVQLNETLPKRPSIGESSAPRNEEYGNLLISVGEEMQTFICQTCNKIFDTLALLNNHKKYSHKSSLRCTKCSKRFAIVESLVKHNLTHHPETVASASVSETNEIQVNDQQTKDKETNERHPSPPPIRNSVARKKTNGTITPTRSSVSSPSPLPEILEYVISSDDDVEITDVIEKDTTSSDTMSNNDANKESSRIDNIITAALEPQKSSNSENIDKDCPMLFGNPVQQIIFEQNKKKTVESEQPKDPEIPIIVETSTIDDDIFMIDDSDDENGAKAKISNEEPFLIEDDNSSSSSLHIRKSRGFSCTERTPIVDKLNRPQRKESSDSCPSTTTDAETNPQQKIVVVPSAEDKEHMDAASSSSVKAKITNEQSYVNYIFNKCSYIDKPDKREKRWFLKDIHKFTEKTFLPIQIVQSTNDDMSVEYGPVETFRSERRQAFWDTVHAIDIGNSMPTPSKTLNSYPNKMINVGKPSESAVKTNCIGPTSKNSLLKTCLQTSPKTQSDTKVANTLTTVAKVGPTQMVSSSANLPKSTAQNSPSFSSPIFTVSNQQFTPVSGTVQNVTSSPNVTFPNNHVTSPSVAVSPPVLQNYNQETSKLINIALQNAANNYIQQNNQIRSYSKVIPYSTIAPKPVLPVSPNRAPTNQELVDKTVDLQQTAPNGYILVGLSAAQTNNGIDEDTNSVSQQPIVINGMSYPSFTKTRNTNQPTFMLQQFAPQTNVSMQNCVNICQKSVTTVTEQYAAVPFMIQSQPQVSIATVAQSMPQTTLVQSHFPTGQMVSSNLITTQMVPSNLTAPLMQSNSQNVQMVQTNAASFQSVQSINQNVETVNSDSCDSTTRPTIRIKTLSELTGDNLDINQRNELHNLYSSAVTNYVQNHSTSTSSQGTSDEYLQIS